MNFFLKLYCHLRSSLFQFTFGTRLELNYAHLWFHSSKWHHVSTQLQCSWTFIMHIFSSIRFVSLTIPTIFFGRYSHFIFSMVAHWLQLPQYNTIFFIFVPSSMLHTHTHTNHPDQRMLYKRWKRRCCHRIHTQPTMDALCLKVLWKIAVRPSTTKSRPKRIASYLRNLSKIRRTKMWKPKCWNWFKLGRMYSERLINIKLLRYVRNNFDPSPYSVQMLHFAWQDLIGFC